MLVRAGRVVKADLGSSIGREAHSLQNWDVCHLELQAMIQNSQIKQGGWVVKSTCCCY